MLNSLVGALLAVVLGCAAHAEASVRLRAPFDDKFRQLEGEEWPTAGDYRNASGAPGHRYWQQKVDYEIAARLDEDARAISGRARITYHNRSPDDLEYLWLLLDQNRYRPASDSELSRTVDGEKVTYAGIRRAKRFQQWAGGFSIRSVRDGAGRELAFSVTDSLLRVDLPQPLRTGGQTRFSIEWSFPLVDVGVFAGRGGYECFTEHGGDGNCIFQGAQWFPRLVAYSDYEGWHNKVFLGSGEFALEFGDYRVSLTVPSDHVVAATGELQNPAQVLTSSQRQRLERARTSAEPIYIITPEEAIAAQRGTPSGEKTWTFSASNVRDFAWASSRKYLWDAMGVRQNSAERPITMAMSFYPNEARPLWDAYSTKAIAHALRVYSSFTFPYPYPTAISANGPVAAMEYPMIAFNGPRPVRDRDSGVLTYSEAVKHGFISIVLHETGHNYFPMLVNSDERQWAWLDEGLNSFLQFQAEKAWDAAFPSQDGEPRSIVQYMLSREQSPIMTQSDSAPQYHAGNYSKPAAALVVLRETILGRERFDRAFREYARRWYMKRPTPYDFFRTMEESSGVDLDWFWRGWFYSTAHVDIALAEVVRGRVPSGDPEVENRWLRTQQAQQPRSLTAARNTARTMVERDPGVRDFYDDTDEFAVTDEAARAARNAREALTPAQREAQAANDNFYRFSFGNVGGLVMPILLEMEFTDGSKHTVRIPAEVWRKNPRRVTWEYVTPKELAVAQVDPLWETADALRENNVLRGPFAARTLELEKVEAADDRMRDSGMKVEPGSIKASPITGARVPETSQP